MTSQDIQRTETPTIQKEPTGVILQVKDVLSTPGHYLLRYVRTHHKFLFGSFQPALNTVQKGVIVANREMAKEKVLN